MRKATKILNRRTEDRGQKTAIRHLSSVIRLQGFTLIEIIMTVAIIVILVSMVVGITKRIDDQNKERLCRNELALIDNALEQFRDFGFDYKERYAGLGLNFPLDCSGFDEMPLEQSLYLALYFDPSLSTPMVYIKASGTYLEGLNDPCDSGSEALYFILCQVPECRRTLDKIDKSLLSDKVNGTSLIITVGCSGPTTETFPLNKFVDPWGKTLRYYYYDVDSSLNPPMPILSTKKTFPVITSAGPDRKFGTNDDIVNRQGK